MGEPKRSEPMSHIQVKHLDRQGRRAPPPFIVLRIISLFPPPITQRHASLRLGRGVLWRIRFSSRPLLSFALRPRPLDLCHVWHAFLLVKEHT